jgi:fermentation-respiration switch protein FrsA (DUF1100 family)
MIDKKNIYKMLNFILLVAGIYIVITVILYIFQSSLVFFPDRKIILYPNQAGMEYEDVNFRTCDNIELHGWFIPSTKHTFTILFCHGNAGNISHRLGSIGIFHQIGLNVFIFDYRGFGNSDGNPSERGSYADAHAAWNYLVERENIKPENIILFGRSLGSGVAAWLAKEKKAKAVILESSFTSIPDLGRKYYPIFPVKLISRIKYPVIEYVQQATCAKLFIHSINDELIPYNHGQKNFAKAKEPKDFLEIQGSHNEGFMVSKDKYIEGIKKFIRTLQIEKD